MTFYIILLLAGLLGGFIAGLLGVGGGIIFISVLPIALTSIGVSNQEIVQYTIANSIFGTLFASVSGSINLFRNNEFHIKEILMVSSGSVLLSLLSLKFFVNTPYYSKSLFNSIVIIVLIFVLFQTIKKARVSYQDPIQNNKRPYFLAGAAGGFIASLTGLGGGTVIIPILNMGLKMDFKRAKAISLGVIVFTSTVMTIYNMLEMPRLPLSASHWGYIIFPVAIPLSIGVMLTSSLGVRLGRKLPSYQVSYIFAGFILILIVYKALGLINT